MTISEQSPQAEGALDATHRLEHEPGREHDHAHVFDWIEAARIAIVAAAAVIDGSLRANI